MANNTVVLPIDIVIQGSLSATTFTVPANAVTNASIISTAAIARTKLAEEEQAVYRIPLQSCRSNTGLVLNATGGDTLFSIANGGYGVGTLTLKAEEAVSETETTTLCFEFALPPEYIAAGTVNIAIQCKVDSSGAGNASVETLDCEVWELADAGTVGSDLVSTTIQTIATDAFAAYTFAVTATSLVAGDKVLVFVRTAITEDAGTAVYAVIGNIEVRLDIKG